MTASNISDEHYLVSEYPRQRASATATEVAGGAAQAEAMRPDSCAVDVSLGTIQERSRACDQPNLSHTRKERDSQILQNYLQVEKDFHFRAGAKKFLAYLEHEHRSLAEVTTSDPVEWARTPSPSGKAKGNLPSEPNFRGAKRFCAFAGQVGYIDAQRAKDIAECRRQHVEPNELRSLLQNPRLSSEERANHIRLNYQLAEKNANRQGGARDFLAYLKTQNKALAEVTTSDLQRWGLIPLTKGRDKASLPTGEAFEGARGLCALAAEVGYIQAQPANDFSGCKPLPFDRDALRRILQDPALTRKVHEDHLRLYFQSVDKGHEHQTGASAFLAYLENQQKSLAEVTTSDLQEWALTPVTSRRGKAVVPNPRHFDGAKAFCALAAQVEYVDGQRAKEFGQLQRPQFGVDALRSVLQNPALTPKEREHHIRLTYQSSENIGNRYGGALGFLAYLESAEIPLSEVRTSDLVQWALTPMKINGNLPDATAFEGAKALCALAVEVGHIVGQRALELATCPRPYFELDFLRMVLQNPGLSRKEREYHIHLNYQSLEKDHSRRSGAKGILAFLEKNARSLSEVSTTDLQQWALTPLATGKGKGCLPSVRTFEGAKALCALAAEVGHIDAQRAQNLALCSRPEFDADSLRMLIHNSELTRKERDDLIRLSYQSVDNDFHRQSGARSFLAYLESRDMSLAEASKSDLQTWALTPFAIGNSKLNVPNSQAFEGAKALCALAAEVGHLDAHHAQELASCGRPQLELDSLRRVLQNPTLTRKEREGQICLNLYSAVKCRHLLKGASAFLAYLERQERSLAEVTKNDLWRWVSTPFTTVKGKQTLPNQRGFSGAKALCALAAEVGYIDAQSAKEIAEYTFPQPGVLWTNTSEASLQTAASSRALLERANKRLRTDDQGASPSISPSLALPESDALFRDLALSPPTLLQLNQHASSAQAVSTLSLIDGLESLHDILGSSGQFY